MFGLGTWEIVLILVLILLVFGPKRLPELARSLGKTLSEFRRATDEVKKEFESAGETKGSDSREIPSERSTDAEK